MGSVSGGEGLEGIQWQANFRGLGESTGGLGGRPGQQDGLGGWGQGGIGGQMASVGGGIKEQVGSMEGIEGASGI